jgi:cell division protein FtsI (penicillin-binding protein 3)
MYETEETNRVRILARVALVWAAILVVRLVQLQVFSHKELQEAAQRQQELQQEIRVPRAAIRDRLGRPLAKSIPAESVCVNPLRIPDPGVAAEILGRILELDAPTLRDRISDAAKSQRGFLWVKRKISSEEEERLRSLNLDWIEFRTESKRCYPNGELAAHVVGTVDFRERGNSGIELEFNSELEGKPGEVRMVTDVKRRAYDSEVERPPVPAKEITLTIDSRIQFVAERELASAAERTHARSGSVVAMDAKTGEILALANWPTFDPNQPVQKDRMAERNDVAVTSPYEPGSVFKIVTLSAAIEEGAVTPSTMINCGNGVLRLGSRVIHEAHHGYGLLSAADVLAKSSNIGAIQIATRLGQDKLYEYVRRFGFGQPTGIPLPSESAGMLRKIERWGKTSYASVAMGHEISVTAVQLARACSVVANNGYMIQPRLIRKMQAPGGPEEHVAVPPPVRVISPETAIKMRQMMEGVVLHGTGKHYAQLKGYTSAGKTGTAQIFDLGTRQYTHLYNGSFVGFAPVGNPRIVIVVTLNGTSGGTAGYGGPAAGPVFREVATAALRLLDVPKDLPEDLPEDDKEPVDPNDLSIAGLDPDAGAELVSSNPQSLVQGSLGQALFSGPAVTPAAAVGPRVPDFQGKTMRDVIQQAAAEGIAVEVIGHGLARAQLPPAGAVLPPGERVKVQFAR